MSARIGPVPVEADLAAALADRSERLKIPQAQLIREAVEFYVLHVTDEDTLFEARKERLRHAVATMGLRARERRRTKSRTLHRPDDHSRTGAELAAHLAPYRFKPGQSGNPNGRPVKGGRCSQCREAGHNVRSCPSASERRPSKCSRCDKPGHNARTCPGRIEPDDIPY